MLFLYFLLRYKLQHANHLIVFFAPLKRHFYDSITNAVDITLLSGVTFFVIGKGIFIF